MAQTIGLRDAEEVGVAVMASLAQDGQVLCGGGRDRSHAMWVHYTLVLRGRSEGNSCGTHHVTEAQSPVDDKVRIARGGRNSTSSWSSNSLDLKAVTGAWLRVHARGV